jgi:site-specific recombinase XerD
LDAHNFINRVFVPGARKAKIQDFHWHDLRHTFASRLAMRGVDLRAIAELMGHKTIQMTMRYAHLAPGYLADAVRTLDKPPKGRGGTGTNTGTSAAGKK